MPHACALAGRTASNLEVVRNRHLWKRVLQSELRCYEHIPVIASGDASDCKTISCAHLSRGLFCSPNPNTYMYPMVLFFQELPMSSEKRSYKRSLFCSYFHIYCKIKSYVFYRIIFHTMKLLSAQQNLNQYFDFLFSQGQGIGCILEE